MDEWGFGWPERPAPRPSVMAANALYLLAGAGNLLLPIAALGISMVAPGLRTEALSMNVSAVYELLVLLLPVLWYWRGRPEIAPALRIKRPKGKHVAIAAAAAFVGLFLSNALGTLWCILLQSLGLRLVDVPLRIGAGPMGLVAALLGYAALPALCEELLFRGAMLGAYERGGTARAAALTSALFALLHASVEGFPVQLLIGLALAYCAVNADSVFVAVAYHFVHNLGSVLFSVALPEGSGVDMAGSVYHQIGGMAGVLQALVLMAVLGAAYAVLLLMMSSDREVAGRPFGHPRPAARASGTWQEQLVLLSGAVTVGVLMGISVLRALRVIE